MHQMLLAHADKTRNRRISVRSKFPPLVISAGGLFYIAVPHQRDTDVLRYVEADVYLHEEQAVVEAGQA